jgi:hypothetical protein
VGKLSTLRHACVIANKLKYELTTLQWKLALVMFACLKIIDDLAVEKVNNHVLITRFDASRDLLVTQI